MWLDIDWAAPRGTGESVWDERGEQLAHQMSVWGSSTLLSQLVWGAHYLMQEPNVD